MSAQLFVSLISITLIANLMLLATAYLILLERKVSAWTQDRIGPNRTNFSFGLNDLWDKIPGIKQFMQHRHFGLGQALADGLKLLVKEDYSPPHVDRILFLIAPVMALVPAMVGWAVIPWGGYWFFPGIDGLGIDPGMVSVAVAPVSIGVIYILAVSSLAVYGVVVGAYASNNKFAFLGGLRATAQMLSYEIPMGLCVLVMVLMYGSADTGVISAAQAGAWNAGAWGIVMHPLLAAIFFTCVLAECNRAPFDLAEAEQELVGGFHTEYSAMKWALYFLGEYMHMITGSAFFAILFLGGWDLLPFFHELPTVAGTAEHSGLAALGLVVLKFLIFVGKIAFLLFVMMWVRWTLPRFRFDQLMKLAWRSMIPMVLVILLISGFLVYFNIHAWYAYAIVNIAVAAGGAVIGPMLPQGPPINRKIRLAGSRFNPLLAEDQQQPA